MKLLCMVESRQLSIQADGIQSFSSQAYGGKVRYLRTLIYYLLSLRNNFNFS